MKIEVTQLRPTSFEEVCTILGESPDKYEPVEGVETPQDAALRKIKAIVKVMNKGEAADFTNENQAKYYPYFDLSKGVSLHSVYYSSQFSLVPPSSCYLSSKDCEYAVETFFEIYKTAFTNENN